MVLRPAEVRGNKISQDELNKVVPGRTTQADASTICNFSHGQGNLQSERLVLHKRNDQTSHCGHEFSPRER